MMMTEAHRKMLRSHGMLVARVLLGLLFVVTGTTMLTGMGVSGVAGMIEGQGVPFSMLFAIIMLIIKIGGGAALILGYRVGTAAAALIVFVLAATWFGHVNLDEVDQLGALKNLSIVGGLLYVMAYGAGEGWRITK